MSNADLIVARIVENAPGILYYGEFNLFKPMTGAAPEDAAEFGELLLRTRPLLEGLSDSDVEVIAFSADAIFGLLLPQMGNAKDSKGQPVELDDDFFECANQADLALCTANAIFEFLQEDESRFTKAQMLAACAMVQIAKAFVLRRHELPDHARWAIEALELVMHAEYAAGLHSKPKDMISEITRRAAHAKSERRQPARDYLIHLYLRGNMSKAEAARQGEPEVLRLCEQHKAPLKRSNALNTMGEWLRNVERQGIAARIDGMTARTRTTTARTRTMNVRTHTTTARTRSRH